EAQAAYAKALGLNPAIAEAHGNLGLALQDQGRLAQAAAAIRKSLELRPHFFENRVSDVVRVDYRLFPAPFPFQGNGRTHGTYE
ncbi:MAG: tetratricopeptide repeat protein, partial [Chloroflexi bacterium]|nr:tetratricopeptide repeat protein [Chloroflexota bacterium]